MKNVGEDETYEFKNEKIEIKKPGIVHRLDRDTSGVLLLAKNEKALGVYHDTLLLLNDGILMQKGPQTFTLEPSFTVGNITPSALRLSYTGLVIFNAARLDTIPKDDFDDILAVLT